MAPEHYYPPPGPPDDPWGPYIREAAARYAVPEQWVRAVMQQESGGQEQAVSPVGAMGLMQVMPETYQGLQARYGLGDDPYDPHNNILAGTAYIREMYDRFGAPGFLAAYNAGPDRVDSYLAGSRRLAGRDGELPGRGYAEPRRRRADVRAARDVCLRPHGRGIGAAPSVASLAAGCDLNAAYDPNHPCSSLMQAAATPAPVAAGFRPTQTGAGGCDLSTAYDPDHPCTSVGTGGGGIGPATRTAGSDPTGLCADGGRRGCDLSAAYDPSHPCTSAGQTVAASAPPPANCRPTGGGRMRPGRRL